MDHNLVFDIETVPQDGPLSSAQEAQLEKKLKGECQLPYLTGSAYLALKEEEKRHYDSKVKMIRGTDPYLGKIVVIGLLHAQESSGFGKSAINKFAITGKEEDILKEFWAYLSKERFRFISYNGLGFDVPWIIKRSMHHGIQPTNENFLITRRYTRWPHTDLQQVLADWDRRNSCTLDLACETFGIPTPKDGKIAAADVASEFEKGNIKGIADYCVKDITATYELFKLAEQYQPNNT